MIGMKPKTKLTTGQKADMNSARQAQSGHAEELKAYLNAILHHATLANANH